MTLSVDVDAFASVMWRKILRDKNKPGMLVRRHLEVCVFWGAGNNRAVSTATASSFLNAGTRAGGQRGRNGLPV